MATIQLLSVGSRGDLQPYLAILLELQRRGHAIQLIGSVNFEAIATAHAIPFVPLPGDYRQLLASKQGLEAMLTTAAAAMAGTDLLLVTPLALWGYHYFSLLKWRQDSRVIQAWRRERGLALPASVYVLEECPHSWLFPQLKGAIHYGGASTTATTLGHGLPSTVVAFFADQPAWGREPGAQHGGHCRQPQLSHPGPGAAAVAWRRRWRRQCGGCD